MKRFRFLPLEDGQDHVKVVMADPLDFATREAIRNAYGKPLQIFYASAEIIAQFLYQWYEAEVDLQESEDEFQDGMDLDEQLWDNPEQLRDMASEAPIVRLVNHLIGRAVELGASDIHIEPLKKSVKVRYRIDGIVHHRTDLPSPWLPASSAASRPCAPWTSPKRSVPRRAHPARVMNKEFDLRVSTYVSMYGETVVIRILPRESTLIDLSAWASTRPI